MTGCFPRVLWLDASPSPTRAWGQSPPREACVYFTLHTFFQHKEAQAEASLGPWLAHSSSCACHPAGLPSARGSGTPATFGAGEPWLALVSPSRLLTLHPSRSPGERATSRPQLKASSGAAAKINAPARAGAWLTFPQTHHRVGAHRGSRPRSSAAAPNRQCRNTLFPEASGEAEVLPVLADL